VKIQRRYPAAQQPNLNNGVKVFAVASAPSARRNFAQWREHWEIPAYAGMTQ